MRVKTHPLLNPLRQALPGEEATARTFSSSLFGCGRSVLQRLLATGADIIGVVGNSIDNRRYCLQNTSTWAVT